MSMKSWGILQSLISLSPQRWIKPSLDVISSGVGGSVGGCRDKNGDQTETKDEKKLKPHRLRIIGY